MTARVTLLGGAFLGDRSTGAVLPADRRGCLLAYLANDGGWVDRNRLALLFWPDSQESMAKRNLRQLLLRVRRLPLEPALEVTDEALRWGVRCDVDDFRTALAGGDHAEAVALYQGPLLAGFTVHDVGGFDTWLESERDRLHAAFHGACMREVAVATARGDHQRAAELLSRLLELDPMAEDVVEALVRALYLGGRRDAAIQAYERFAQELALDLGLEPLDDTRALVEQVRRGHSLVPPAVPETPDRAEHDRLLQPVRLVAREADKQALRAARTAVIAVVGEPGVGKTALLRELLPDALWSGASEGLERLPYHPLAALVRARPDLAATLGPYREDLARLVPEATPDIVPAPLDPATAKGRLAEALARLVEAGGRPLVIDDLQWADPATLETLVYFAGRGLNVYGAYRTGEATPELAATLDALRTGRSLTEVALEPLPEEGVRALIAQLMNRSEGPPTFARQMWTRSGGNPLFLLETLRSLFESGAITADERGWHTAVDEITLDYSELDVPTVVSEVIARRLTHLRPRTVRVLEALALTRAAVDARLLAQVTGLSLGAVAEALDEASEAGFLGSESFRHDLLRQALENRVEPARGRVLHALLAEALTERADPGVVAEHWWRAGEPRRARSAWLEQAAAMRSGGLQVDAIAVLTAVLERLPDSEDADWIRLALADASREAGRPADAEALVEAVERAGRDAPALRLRTVIVRAWLHYYRSSIADAKAILEESTALAAVTEDENLLLDHLLLRGLVAKEQQRSDEAIALLEPVVARLRRGKPTLRTVQFTTSLAALYDDGGRSEEGLPLHLEALALAKALGSRYLQVDACLNLLFCYADLGRYEEAFARAEEALGLGDYDNVPVLRINLAANYFQAGRFREALEHYTLLTKGELQPHLRLIALARCAECNAELGTHQAPLMLDAALDALPTTDFAVAQGSVAIAVYRFGSREQVERLRQSLPDLDASRLPAHQRRRLEDAMAARK